MATILSCINNQKNIGVSNCKKLPQLPSGFITTPSGFSVPEASLNDASFWQDALLADKGVRIYYWPKATSIENQNEDAVYEETPLSIRPVRQGRYRWRFFFSENLEMHKAIQSHRNFEGRILIIDEEKKVIGTQLSNGNFAGFTLGMFNPEKLRTNDGSSSSMTPVYVSLADHKELDDNGGQIDGTFLNSLVRLTSATLEIVGTPTATEIVVSVKSSLDLVPVLGLVLADFVLLDGSGSSQTITTVTDNSDGTYTLAGSAFVAGTLDLVDPDSLSVVGFEAEAPVTVTI